jgi:hypothetical protein
VSDDDDGPSGSSDFGGCCCFFSVSTYSICDKASTCRINESSSSSSPSLRSIYEKNWMN